MSRLLAAGLLNPLRFRLSDALDQAIVTTSGFLGAFLVLRPEPPQGSLQVGETASIIVPLPRGP